METQNAICYTFPANGKWQTLLSDLKGISTYEINAYSQGVKGQGKYSVIHSVVLNSFNGKGGRIKNISCDYYKWYWWNRIKLRWVGNPYNYELQIKTSINYGPNGKIVVTVKNLLKTEYEFIE